MLNFLGITRHLSTTAGYAKRIGWLLREDVTHVPFPVTGVSFTGVVKTEQGDLPISISHGEQENYLELVFPALPIGRWPYAIHAQDESGEDLRLFSGYIGAVESVAPIEASTVYDIPVMGIAIPIEAGKTIKAQWLSNTSASVSAQQAQEDAAGAHTDAETASKAATTATGAASTATERAKEADGYARAAYASKVAAGNSEAAAGTSAADAARDAKRAQDYRASMEELASSWPQTVSNGEQAVSAAKDTATAAIQAKQADSVLAVGRASQTAQQNIASAQSTAVTAVETAQNTATVVITPLVEQVETAKTDAQAAKDAAEQIVNGLTISTGTVTTGEPGSQAAATLTPGSAPGSYALDMTIPQGQTGAVDTAQAYVWTQPQTYAAMINANAGVNIPMAAGAAMDTASVNRAYALGMAHTVMMHQARAYWLASSCAATNGVTINHVVPGCYCEVLLGANTCTSLTMPTAGAVGSGNYSKILGYSIPLRYNGGSPGAWMKTSLLIGTGDQWTEHPDGGMDDFRFRPVAGSSPSISRLVEVTLYYQDEYKARVRELIGAGNPRNYVVRTTESDLDYNSNTNPCSSAYRLVIAQSQLSYTDALTSSVWLIMGGADNDTVIKLADIRGWDTYHMSGPPTLYLDVQGGIYGGWVKLESPTIINGIGENTYVRYGLEPYQRSWITSEEEVPYSDPEQPTA